jgi:hypothetical protein
VRRGRVVVGGVAVLRGNRAVRRMSAPGVPNPDRNGPSGSNGPPKRMTITTSSTTRSRNPRHRHDGPT